MPWTDDTRFYVPAAQSYAGWFAGIFSHGLQAFTREQINQAFSVNHEHPPVGKYAMGLGWLIFHKGLGLNAITACRTGVVALFAFTGFSIFATAQAYTTRLAASVGTATFLLLPRVLFHGQVATLDMAVTAFSFASVIWFWKAKNNGGWSIIPATLLFALALGSKLNAPFIGLACAIFVFIDHRPRFCGTRIVLPRIPWVLFSMGLISPLLVFMLWPWLWFSTIERLQNYISFHSQHYLIYNYFAGTLYSTSPAPMSAPVLQTLLTTPAPVLVLTIIGLFAPWQIPHLTRARPVALLAALQIVVQLILVSLPWVPKYGGVKLFLPIFPFMALLTAFGFAYCHQALGHVLHKYLPDLRTGIFAKAAMLLSIMVPALVGVWGFHGALLSSYNGLVGGLRGATTAGYERQYYDLAYSALPELLEKALPQGGTFAIAPNPKEYRPYIRRWYTEGNLPRNVRLVPFTVASIKDQTKGADVLVLTHERRWASYPQLVQDLRRLPLLERIERGGIPLVSLFSNSIAPRP